MHPAYSIIVFTVLSGTGYGMVTTVALADLAGLLTGYAAAAAFGIGLVLISAGLASSALHLGRPERAWRALSQWRSSWLSREGVLALVTFVPLVAYGYGIAFGDGQWSLMALPVIAGAAATVYCTSMIYASLAPVPNWSNRLVPPGFMLLSLAGGSVCALSILSVFGAMPPALALLALAACASAWVLKWRYWRSIDGARLPVDAADATGLAAFGKVRSLAWPHTEENYLLREMGYRIARKHALKLRRLALFAGAALPIILIVVSVAMPWPGARAALLVLGALAIVVGLLIERWLFFAEAKHTVTLYYGI